MNTSIKKEYNDFINDEKIFGLLKNTKTDKILLRDIIAKSLSKKPLNLEECAALLNTTSLDDAEEIFNAARQLKRDVYGNRIVIFAPLYVGNHCINDCQYCAFRKTLRETVRKTLNEDELVKQVEALIDKGHKRLILVFGEHPKYTPSFIAETVKKVYSIKKGNGEIRRVNINAAPLETEDYKIIKQAGIGTYQVFQETYHKETYAKVHPKGTHKGDYLYRLHGLTRAFEAGCDDVGIGALFGLYDWKFEMLGLLSHAHFLTERFNCGPHTISFPRLRPAHGFDMKGYQIVSDFEFKKLVAILRLSVPYTGLILTARETPEIRKEVMAFGVSQIDAGTRIELAGYTDQNANNKNTSQFQIGDLRSMDEIICELAKDNYIPSFCTSCYRQGRTGEHFMEFAIPGFIENFCTPNALFTFKEYLCDYASKETMNEGLKIIEKELQKIKDEKTRKDIALKLDAIEFNGKRDEYL